MTRRPPGYTSPDPLVPDTALYRSEQGRELLQHGAAELVRVEDRHRTPVVARDVMADADGDEFDGRAQLDPLDDLAQVAFPLVAGVARQGRIVERRPVGDHPQHQTLHAPPDQSMMPPPHTHATDLILLDPP